MKKSPVILSFLLGVVLVAGLVASCSQPAPPRTTAPATAAATGAAPATTKPFVAPKSMMTLTAGGGLSTSVYGITCAIAPILEQTLGTKVRVTPLEIVRERYSGLRDGSITMNLAAIGNAALGQEAQEAFAAKTEGPQKNRMLWHFYDNTFGYLTRGDSGIKRIYDIKGKRISLGVHSPGCIRAINGLLAFVNLTENDVQLVPFGSWAAINRAVAEGKSDVTYAAAESAVTYEIESGPNGIFWFDMPFEDKAGWARFLDIMTTNYPAKVTDGAKSAIGKQSFGVPYGWVVHSTCDEELAYQITRVMWEKYPDYKDLHPMLKYAAPDLQRPWLDVSPMPYHPGAIRFFKEKGVWTAEDDKWNDAFLQLEKDYDRVWADALKEAQAKNIAVDTSNKDWMALWDSYRVKISPFKIRLKA